MPIKITVSLSETRDAVSAEPATLHFEVQQRSERCSLDDDNKTFSLEIPDEKPKEGSKQIATACQTLPAKVMKSRNASLALFQNEVRQLTKKIGYARGSLSFLPTEHDDLLKMAGVRYNKKYLEIGDGCREI